MKIDFEEGQTDSETWFECTTITFTRDEMLARRNTYGVFDRPRMQKFDTGLVFISPEDPTQDILIELGDSEAEETAK